MFRVLQCTRVSPATSGTLGRAHDHESVTVAGFYPRLDNGERRMGEPNREDNFLGQLAARVRASLIIQPTCWQ